MNRPELNRQIFNAAEHDRIDAEMPSGMQIVVAIAIAIALLIFAQWTASL